MNRLHVIFHGEVQGVFFRDYVKKTADSLKLTGWVKNAPDGTVEAVAEGDEELLKQLLKKCKTGPPLAKVDKTTESWENATGEFTDFRVSYR